MKNFSFLLAFFFLHLVAAQELTLRRGVILDSLPVNDSIAETYSLYLPTNFSTDKTWPIIFLFDPEGRGRAITQLVRQAGEEQGYIVAGSNAIAKDSTLQYNATVGTRFVNAIFNYFPIDGRQIYTGGLAEGARVASVMPVIYPAVQGVMAVGDTWINTDFIRQGGEGADFFFVGLAGYEDHRLPLLEDAAVFFRKAGMEALTYRFNGGNEWPEFDMIANAMGFFTLQAMKKGDRPTDMALVEKLYRDELDTAERLRTSMQFYKAHEHLEKMERKYAAYGKEQELKEYRKTLRKSKVFKDQRRQYNRAAATEEELNQKYLYFFNEDVYSANFENLGWWSQQVKELQELQESRQDAEAEMGHRVLGFLRSLADNSFRDLQEANAAIDPLIFTAILQTIFDKEEPKGYFNIISLSARDGDYYTALLYLEDLLKTGYRDLESLYNIPGTLDLKLSPEYNKIIQEYLGESKYYRI